MYINYYIRIVAEINIYAIVFIVTHKCLYILKIQVPLYKVLALIGRKNEIRRGFLFIIYACLHMEILKEVMILAFLDYQTYGIPFLIKTKNPSSSSHKHPPKADIHVMNLTGLTLLLTLLHNIDRSKIEFCSQPTLGRDLQFHVFLPWSIAFRLLIEQMTVKMADSR
jgi:hypothetical protein